MTSENTLLKLSDLKLGMKVSESSLKNIKGIYITLIDSEYRDNDIFGTIAFIGRRLNRRSDFISKTSQNICAIYNSEEDIDGEVTYDE